MRRSQPTSSFVSPEAHTAFMGRYEHMLQDWPPHERVTVPTRYGPTGVLVAGAAHRPPVVLLHGRYTPAPSWTPVIHELTEKYCVYAVDTIGEPGLSINEGAGLRSAEDYTTWLRATFDGLDLTISHVCGHSFGGWLAARLALAEPSRLASLTLLEPAQVFAPFTLRWMLHCVRPYLFPTRRNIDRLFRWAGQGRHGHDDIVELATLGMLGFRMKAPEASLVPAAQLRLLDMPAQQLVAARSVVHESARARRRSARINPAVQTRVLADSSHFIVHDQPAQVIRALDDLITVTER